MEFKQEDLTLDSQYPPPTKKKVWHNRPPVVEEETRQCSGVAEQPD